MNQALNVIAGIIVPGATAADLNWAGVRYAELAKVRSALAAKYSSAMANKCLAALRGAMKTTFRMGLIDADSLAQTLDVRRIRGERAPKGRFLDGSEIGKLIAACDQTSARGVRNAAIIAIGLGGGLRRAEIVGLNVNDVLERGEALRILGKGNKERIVYLPDWAQAYLTNWLEHRGHQEGSLFCAVGRRGISLRRLTEQTVYDVLRVLAQRTGLEPMSPHDLRRAFISTLLDQKVSLSTIALMVGHAEIATTARYDRRGERAKREAAKTLVFAGPAQN